MYCKHCRSSRLFHQSSFTLIVVAGCSASGASGCSSVSSNADEGSSDEVDVIDAADLEFSGIPAEVVAVIFRSLDPVSLAAAACVSR